jgi:lysophospholipase L1-like esterase
MPTFPKQTMLAIATFAAILLAVHYGIRATKGLNLAALRPIIKFPSGRASLIPIVKVPSPPVPAILAVPKPKVQNNGAAIANATPDSQFLIDNDGVLDHFYAALRDLHTGQSRRTVRILHYGDSPTTADLITGDARDLLQERFGNAGPGFILIAKPWAWYGHHNIDISATGWQIDTAVDSMREANYGLGGAIFTGPVGATSTIRLTAHDSTSIEVEYLQEPGGGNLDITADGAAVGAVTTAGTKKNAATTIPIPVGTKQVKLTVSGSPVQVFGVVFGRDNRGLTYDSIGLNGASTTVMSRAFNPQTFSEALEHRNPDLVVINYGTNESSFPSYVEKQYELELIRAISRVRAALPDTSILIMSPMDRGERSGDQITTMRAIPEIVAIQQRVADQTGCGFFNTYQAMGGNGTMARWYDRHPAMVGADLIHPSAQGARIVAQLLTGQLLIGYERYMENHPGPQPKLPAPVISATSTQPNKSKPMGVQ